MPVIPEQFFDHFCRSVVGMKTMAYKEGTMNCINFSMLFADGKAMATAYDCKFIETSVGINHNVDELLVGLLSQIRLKLENPEKSR